MSVPELLFLLAVHLTTVPRLSALRSTSRPERPEAIRLANRNRSDCGEMSLTHLGL